jgi:hypothetical protein
MLGAWEAKEVLVDRAVAISAISQPETLKFQPEN